MRFRIVEKIMCNGRNLNNKTGCFVKTDLKNTG